MIKSKMARRFNIEEVLEQGCMNHNLQIQPDNVVKDKENDTEKRLSDCLANYEGREGFDGTLFVKTAAKLLLSLVNVCETSVKPTPDMETPDISKIMVSSSINLAVILKSESRLWLKQIYRRLRENKYAKAILFRDTKRYACENIFVVVPFIMQFSGIQRALFLQRKKQKS